MEGKVADTLLDEGQRAALGTWMILVQVEMVKLRAVPNTAGMALVLMDSVLANGVLFGHA